MLKTKKCRKEGVRDKCISSNCMVENTGVRHNCSRGSRKYGIQKSVGPTGNKEVPLQQKHDLWERFTVSLFTDI